MGPHLTQCCLGRGQYLRIKWYPDASSRLAAIDMGRKLGGCCAPFIPGELVSDLTLWPSWAEAYLHTKWHLDPPNRLATIHQRCR